VSGTWPLAQPLGHECAAKMERPGRRLTPNSTLLGYVAVHHSPPAGRERRGFRVCLTRLFRSPHAGSTEAIGGKFSDCPRRSRSFRCPKAEAAFGPLRRSTPCAYGGFRLKQTQHTWAARVQGRTSAAYAAPAPLFKCRIHKSACLALPIRTATAHTYSRGQPRAGVEPEYWFVREN